MNELIHKYAEVILRICLKVKKGQPLFIYCNTERMDFVEIVTEEALKLGVTDIYYDLYSAQIKHDLYKTLSVDEMKHHQYYNHSIWNTYAKKGAAFLMAAAETPGLMKDIPSDKMKEVNAFSLKSRKEFDNLRNELKVPWCIAAVPTKMWAELLFKNHKDPVTKLWKTIFEICHIDSENPVKYWQNKLAKLNKRAEKLNKYQFTKLKYSSSNNTDFEIGLPKDHIWASGGETLTNKTEVLVNFPTEEVFTSPDYKTANGTVYSSKPLTYQANIIRDFKITFKDGKAISCEAKEGENVLKQIINSCPNANYLGEVALVEYDSPISNSKLVFYETLYDENAACHLALGASFPECIKNGTKMNKKELKSYGMNQCDNHVDFMIGTKDLSIIGITNDNKEIPIFKNGNFTEEFK